MNSSIGVGVSGCQKGRIHKIRFRLIAARQGSNPFQLALVSTRAFPLIIIAVPLAVTYLRVGIDDTIYGVALAHVAFTLPLTVLVMASVFASISYELEEAAMTLGCGRLSAFRRVALPLALPGVAASAIFVFVTTWNEVFAAALLTFTNRTLPAQMLADRFAEFGGDASLIAVMSLNLGDGPTRTLLHGVAREMGSWRSGQRSYWHLYRMRRLPPEAMDYIPRIVASALLDQSTP